MFKKTIIAAFIALIALPIAAYDLVIPASGTGPGAGNSQWQTELILHNVGLEPLTLTLAFHNADGIAKELNPFTIASRTSLVLDDVVAKSFGETATTGALTIELSNKTLLPKLAVASRTFNRTANGDLGQNVPAYPLDEALVPGDTGVLPAATDIAKSRYNVGVFARKATSISWQLVRAAGTTAAEKTLTYKAGQQIQHNVAQSAIFGSTSENGDVIYGKILEGNAFIYGSLTDNASGDPTFVEASRTRENLLPRFVGVDLGENGTIDIVDEDGDRIADSPITIYVNRFGAYFRVVIEDPEGQPVTLSIINSGDDLRFIDNQGTIYWGPGIERAGTTSYLTIRANDGVDSVDFRIPVRFLQ